MHCPPLSSGIITAETWSVLFIRALGRTEHGSFRLEKLPALTFCANQDFIISTRDINETLACTPSTTGAAVFAANRISEGRPAIWSAVLFCFLRVRWSHIHSSSALGAVCATRVTEPLIADALIHGGSVITDSVQPWQNIKVSDDDGKQETLCPFT